MLKRKSTSLGRDWIVLSDSSDDCDSDEPKVLCSVYKTENDFVASESQSYKKRETGGTDNEDVKEEEDINIKFRNFDISSKYRSDLKKWLSAKFLSENILIECVESEFELKFWIKKLLPDPPASPSVSPPSSPPPSLLVSKPVEIDVTDSPILAKPINLPEISPRENFEDVNFILDTTGDVSISDTTSGDNMNDLQNEEENDVDCSDLFFVDTKPKIKETISVPSTTKQANFSILANKKLKLDGDKGDASPIRSSACFNCSGNHSIRECTKPLDSQEISKNKMKYLQKNSRYHKEEDQKFASFTPGKISSKLRHALGISRHDIPLHVYRMRKFGYPPGWLNHARIPDSGIQMFQHNGIEVINPNTEEPNVFEEDSPRDKYDTKLFISYPGFNVPPEPGVEDLSRELRLPPMMEYQSLDSMVKHFSTKSFKSYKTSKRKFGINLNPFHDDLMVADMEVGEESCDEAEIEVVPPLPPCSPPPKPPPPSQEELSEQKVPSGEDKSSERSQSPTLTELEEAKRLLLGQLNETPTHTTRPESTDLGTPILVSASPFSNLPTPEKFSANISDIITFENLPAYTGTYDKLSRVINKVRVELKEIEEDD